MHGGHESVVFLYCEDYAIASETLACLKGLQHLVMVTNHADVDEQMRTLHLQLDRRLFRIMEKGIMEIAADVQVQLEESHDRTVLTLKNVDNVDNLYHQLKLHLKPGHKQLIRKHLMRMESEHGQVLCEYALLKGACFICLTSD